MFRLEAAQDFEAPRKSGGEVPILRPQGFVSLWLHFKIAASHTKVVRIFRIVFSLFEHHSTNNAGHPYSGDHPKEKT